MTSFQCVATDPDGSWTVVDVQIVDETGGLDLGASADGQNDRDCAHSANVSRPVACSGVRW